MLVPSKHISALGTFRGGIRVVALKFPTNIQTKFVIIVFIKINHVLNGKLHIGYVHFSHRHVHVYRVRLSYMLYNFKR